MKYADGKIYVMQDHLEFELDSNVEIKNYTLIKNGTQYVLEISSDVLDFYIITLVFKNPIKLVSFSFPKTSQIIVEDNLMIKSIGESEPYKLSLTYELINQNETTSSNNLFIPILSILILSFLLLFFIFFRKRKFLTINTAFFPEKEKKIIEILLKRKKITQSELQKLLNIPKASLHRHLKNLEKRQYIEIYPYGMTNLIVLKEKEEKKN
ncbi:MAG: winged helix-turn-helix transcriptional regulator [Candidatus Woesearchaeota archaeon]